MREGGAIFSPTVLVDGIEGLPDGPSSEKPAVFRVFLDDYKEHFDPGGRKDLYCLPSGRIGTNQGKFSRDHLLLQVVDAKKGVFRRFGILLIFWREDLEQAERLRQCSPEAASYPCMSFDKEAGRHVIRII